MKIKYLLNLSIIILLLLSSSYAKGDPQITSFTPSAGWAGTDATNGTKVRILGKGFESIRTWNSVFFNNSTLSH